MYKISAKEYLKRYIYFFLGLYILSLGIALSTKADLGVTPVSSLPYVISLVLPFTLGQITIVVQLVYVLCEIAILRKRFNPINFLQIVIVIVYGYFNDFSLMLVSKINPTNYFSRWGLCIASMFILAFGLTIEIRAGVMMLAVDGLMLTISQEFHIEFGKVKIAFDSSQVAISVIISLLSMHTLKGVREGTIVAAICVGLIIKLYYKIFAKLYIALGLTPIDKVAKGEETAEPAIAVSPVHIITIARLAGSAGLEIGQILSKRMGIPVYNKDMLVQAATDMGLDPGVIVEKERNRIFNFFAQINNETYAPMISEEVAESFTHNQQELVEQVANRESCILVGRLGSYFLRNRPNCFHVFLYGDRDKRAAYHAEKNHLSLEAAYAAIDKKDVERARHHEFYTGTGYGEYTHHHLSLDTFAYGVEKTADIIEDAAGKFFQS